MQKSTPPEHRTTISSHPVVKPSKKSLHVYIQPVILQRIFSFFASKVLCERGLECCDISTGHLGELGTPVLSLFLLIYTQLCGGVFCSFLLVERDWKVYWTKAEQNDSWTSLKVETFHQGKLQFKFYQAKQGYRLDV